MQQKVVNQNQILGQWLLMWIQMGSIIYVKSAVNHLQILEFVQLSSETEADRDNHMKMGSDRNNVIPDK